MPAASATGGETSPLAATRNARMNKTFEISGIDWKKSIKRTTDGLAGYPAVVQNQREFAAEVPRQAATRETHFCNTDV